MSDRPHHIVFSEPYDPAAVSRLQAVGRVTVLETLDESALAGALEDCDALLVRSDTCVSSALLAGAPRLRVIGRAGVGLDNIDLAATRERGITVVHTPGAATDAVADLTLGLILALVRRIPALDVMVRGSRFQVARSEAVSCELKELTLGVVGLGRIGRAVARRCRIGFGMRVLYNDVVCPGLLDFVATAVEKERLYRESDVVSLHVPLTEATRGLIDEHALSVFRPGAYLINTARGGVVNCDALAQALQTGSLGGAGLDVVEPEPLPRGHPLLAAPNTVLTPHIGARTHRALARMNTVVEDVVRVLNGEPPRHPA